MNRKEYLAANRTGPDGKYSEELAEKAHTEYYSQFVTEEIKGIVKAFLEREKLKYYFRKQKLTDDKHLNNIPLQKWDLLTSFFTVGPKMRELGDYPTLAGKVCVLKEAARQLIASGEVEV